MSENQIATKVFEALGGASVCWGSMDGTGLFNEARARAIGEQLLVDIAEIHAAAVTELTEAIRLTVEYVGNDTLPALEGWSWFEAMRKYDLAAAQVFEDKPINLGAAESPTTAEWADFFERFDSTVGAPTLTAALVVSLMRGPTPFGCSEAVL